MTRFKQQIPAVKPDGRIKIYVITDNVEMGYNDALERTESKRYPETRFSLEIAADGTVKASKDLREWVARELQFMSARPKDVRKESGLEVGQSWKSKLSVPAPMVMRKARDVTYRLSEIRPSEKGRLAVIGSSYQQADLVPRGWPIPYSGSFRMVGPFGFYRNYKILSLQGRGEELFNIDAGRSERYEQQYELQLSASLLLPLPGAKPKITINQTLTMELLGD